MYVVHWRSRHCGRTTRNETAYVLGLSLEGGRMKNGVGLLRLAPRRPVVKSTGLVVPPLPVTKVTWRAGTMVVVVVVVPMVRLVAGAGGCGTRALRPGGRRHVDRSIGRDRT